MWQHGFCFGLFVLPAFLLLTFSKFHAGIVSSFFPFLVHGSLCIWNLSRLWHWNNLTHQIKMCHGSKSFSSNAIFMCFGLQRFCSLPRRFVGFHFSAIHCFELSFVATLRLCIRFHNARMRFVHPPTGHGCGHRSFQFSPRVFWNFFVLFVIWIDEVNSSQSSSIVELWFFFCPFLFFSILSGFTNFRPNFWPYMIWSGCRLNLFQSLTPDRMYPFGGFSFNRMNFVNPFQESDICLFESTFQ